MRGLCILGKVLFLSVFLYLVCQEAHRPHDQGDNAEQDSIICHPEHH